MLRGNCDLARSRQAAGLFGSSSMLTSSLPASSRFVVPPLASPQRLILFDVMDTLIADPFFRGFEQDIFGLSGGIKSLFAIKDQESFVAFEKGEISEAEHFATYFVDRRPCDGRAVTQYLRAHYQWMPGMHELTSELRAGGVPMAAFSNYPAPWAPLIEEATGLSTIAPWAFISGEKGVRKPSSEAFAAALSAVGRAADDVVFVDDSKTNTDAAAALGIPAIRFEGATSLRPVLFEMLGVTSRL